MLQEALDTASDRIFQEEAADLEDDLETRYDTHQVAAYGLPVS
ncbi:MAG TPA: hypothetical protein VFF74_08325 [Methylophilaceae bacterium]|nr:hypothetical protein [Methylophilaceae bacterium]